MHLKVSGRDMHLSVLGAFVPFNCDFQSPEAHHLVRRLQMTRRKPMAPTSIAKQASSLSPLAIYHQCCAPEPVHGCPLDQALN